MPSDERVGEALRALAAPREAFRSAVAAAAEQVRAFLAVHAAPAPSGPSRAAEELGVFAAGRVDAARFEALFSGAQVVDPAALALAERALEVLAGIAAAGDAAYLAEVSPGGSLRAVVDAALARTGRAFAAGHLFERVRSGRHVPPGDDWGLHSYPPRLWNRAERQIAPPLVVEVDGADLQAGALAEFVQGGQKLVLVVRGPAPPAALVRLITPGVLVLQAASAEALAPLAAGDGPAVAALVPEGAALFRHAPAAAATGHARLTLDAVPEAAPRAIGAYTAFQQQEELRQLLELAAAPAWPEPAAGAPATNGAGEFTPADRLAAWLLKQANLDGTT